MTCLCQSSSVRQGDWQSLQLPKRPGQASKGHDSIWNLESKNLPKVHHICQVEDAIRMQVLECRPESVKSIQSAQTAVPVHKLQNGSIQSPKQMQEQDYM